MNFKSSTENMNSWIADLCVQGTIHQGSDIFSENSRGRQCVANALLSCVYRHVSEKNLFEWQKKDIDKVLQKGDELYSYTREVCNSVYLEPCELPKFLCLEGQKIRWSIDATYSGDMSLSFKDCGSLYSLETALNLCLNGIPHSGIIICNNTAMAVHYSEPYLHVFDSHSRDIEGKTCNSGFASLVAVRSLAHFSQLLRYMFNCRDICAFDLHKLSLKTVDNFLKTKKESEKICFSINSNQRDCICCGSKFLKDEKLKMICSRFWNSVKSGPDYVCKSCYQTWFKGSVRKLTTVSQHMQDTCNLQKNDWVCNTCYEYLRCNKIPPCSSANGLAFPKKPKELELTALEERLVSPRIPFMQLREKPRGGQLSITGNVVNVPADVISTVQKLPRLLSENETIPLKFKRSLSFSHHVAFEQIRPNKVLAAAKWLVENSDLFNSEGIQVNDNWDILIQTANTSDQLDETSSAPEDSGNCRGVEVVDQWTENQNIEDRPSGNMDTVLQCVDFREFNEVISVAPGEKNSPLGLYQDKNAEFLSFPSIYCGQAKPDNKSLTIPIHYSTLCKWELRNVDRRSATCIPNLFFKMKKLQIKQIQDKVMLAVRKCKLNSKKYTAAQMLDPAITNSIVRLNEGYQVLRNLRGSPPYWEKCKKDIFAMIRQLGLPTWFCSFSAAETKWTALLLTLGKLIDKKDYTEEEVTNFTWEDKCRLIKSDPVTCARYFDYRFLTFLREVLQDKSNPIGEIEEYFYRIEFQQRGSPHVHMLVWIKDAPINQSSNVNEVTKFIDKYVSCNKEGAEPFLVNYQTHRHARSCMKKNKPVCRFNFPIPPMPQTVILSPIEDGTSLLKAKKDYHDLSNFLNSPDMKESDLSFNQFLLKIGMDYETYINAVRSSLKQPKIFLQRKPSETRINPYSPILLGCWLANMDIQFILDPYACAAYIVSYISKGQRGMSNLLHKACEEARRGDSDIRQQVRHIGNKFLTHVEIGAQEAAYLVLQMPLRRTSRSIVFINTSPPDERTVLLKPRHILEDMQGDSRDIESGNIVTLYQQRPHALQSICLADFVSNYSVKSKARQNAGSVSVEDDLPESQYEEDTSDFVQDEISEIDFGQSYTFRNGTEIVKRKKMQILRWCHFDVEVDSEKHYRELLMLFLPWRKESDLMGTYGSFQESYRASQKQIENRKQVYEKRVDIIGDMNQFMSFADEDLCLDLVAPGNEHLEQIDQDEGVSLATQFGCFDPGKDVPVYDIGIDLGISRKQIGNENITQWGELEDEEFREMVRHLNRDQKHFFYHVLHWLKTKNEPLYVFLTGGAGVGKSVVIRALYQAALKFFSHHLNATPDNLFVLLCAPTGKAAHNIKGSTIHSTFCLPVGQGFGYKPLEMQQLSAIRSRFMHLKLMFIDEISMVGKGMFNFINLRLQEIKGCKLPFGGVSIVAVGDLFQLKPVMDSWVFSMNSHGYGPIATNLWEQKFKAFELKEVMRQKDDQEFAHLLNRLREGNQTENDLKVLRSRVTVEMASIRGIIHLFTSRHEVEKYNTDVFNGADKSKKVTIKAIDWVIGTSTNFIKEKVLARIPKDSSKTMGLPFELRLVLDISAEITNNVNVSDGVTNGSPCIIKKFDYRVPNSSRVSIVWVEFEDKYTGQKLRKELAHLYHNGIDRNWTPILEITRIFPVRYSVTFQAKRRQFPLQLAAAKTIHKAQGSTLQNAVVHLGSRKNDHIHYVGLSRVTQIQNLHILDLNEKKISVSDSVHKEMERLRTEAYLDLCQQRLDILPPLSTKIVYFNIRSLHRHFQDLQKDFNILSSNVIALSESRLTTSDSTEMYMLPEFSLYRFDFDNESNSRPVYGLALYIRNSVEKRNFRKGYFENIQYCSVEIASSYRWITIVATYFPPKMILSKAKETLSTILSEQSSPFVLLCDANFDIHSSPMFKQFVETEFILQYLETGVTTDYGTVLDQAYTNIPLDEIDTWGTLESYYSDHKPIFIVLK